MTRLIKNAIVIGGTGLVGLELLKQLNALKSCEKITVVVRKENKTLTKLEKVHQFVLEDLLLLNDQDVENFTHAFSCLGTTLKKAGSKENFYNTDFEINAHFADLFELKETHYVLVSAMGADAQSSFFYNRIKGELENYIQTLKLLKTSIIRPSLLLGERVEKRFLETTIQKLYLKFSNLVPNTFKYKPVTAEQVASMMIEVVQFQTTKFQIYNNLQIQKMK